MGPFHVTFSQPDLEADSEVKVISFAGLAVLLLLGSVGYALHRNLPSAWRRGVLCFMLLPMVIGPLFVLDRVGPLRSKMAHFALSFFGVVAGFRWLELICGTGPKGFDDSFKNFVIYFASPAEVLFDEKGQLKASRDGLVSEVLLRIAKHMLIGTFVLSLGRATDFSPFLSGRDPAAMPFLGFPLALPAVYLQTLFAYCTLATAMLMHRLPAALAGIETVDPMQNPLLCSVSLRDFWGRRWNLVVHRLMKRSFFLPLAGLSPRLGGFLAFLMSGLFHEYMWLAVNWHQRDSYVPGLCLVFFLVQFILCALESALAPTALGQQLAALPQPLRTVLTTCVILPFGPLFLQGIHSMGVENSHQGQTFSLVWADCADSRAVSGNPPLDWVMCATVGLIAAAHGLCRTRTARASGVPSRKNVSIVAVDSTCEGA